MSKPELNSNSIIKSFSSQKGSKGFTDELFSPNFDSLFSSKKEILNYEIPTIPKFLKDKKNYFFLNLPYLKKIVAIVGQNYPK